MSRELLAESLPELALLIRRDGTLLAHLGGRAVEWMQPCGPQSASGQSVDSLWPQPFADHVMQLTRRAISIRGTLDSEFTAGARSCEIQVTAQSPDRVVCVIRPNARVGSDESGAPATGERAALDRRGFHRRFKNSISIAALNEKPLALAIIEVDGVADLSRVLDSKVSDQVIAAATRRLPAPAPEEPDWYLGQLSQNLLVVVIETAGRDLIEVCIGRICASLRQPIELGDAKFHLTPHAGVAILGRDATSPKLLLDHARSSAVEARRAGNKHICFFSDTLRLRSLARLDITRELHDAIANHDIRLRYAPRHDLKDGRLVALVGYLQWIDPMRGEVRPADFLSIAESTGLSVALSRSVLDCLQADFAEVSRTLAPEVRISFGALRQHVLSDAFVADIQAVLADGPLTADRLELRISERAYISRDAGVWHALANVGVQLVVDEFGRHTSSLDLLARVPLWGIQLDRTWTTAVETDPVAGRVCRAIVSVASALGLAPIATGIDNKAQRERLAELGCSQGLGDLYPPPDFVPNRQSTAVAG